MRHIADTGTDQSRSHRGAKGYYRRNYTDAFASNGNTSTTHHYSDPNSGTDCQRACRHTRSQGNHGKHAKTGSDPDADESSRSGNRRADGGTRQIRSANAIVTNLRFG